MSTNLTLIDFDERSKLVRSVQLCESVFQLNEALNCISDDLGANLKESLSKVLSMEVDVRPSVQLLALVRFSLFSNRFIILRLIETIIG